MGQGAWRYLGQGSGGTWDKGTWVVGYQAMCPADRFVLAVEENDNVRKSIECFAVEKH